MGTSEGDPMKGYRQFLFGCGNYAGLLTEDPTRIEHTPHGFYFCRNTIRTTLTMESGTSRKFSSVEQYFESLNHEQKVLMNSIRQRIKKAVPEAEELISYNMPAFKLKGMLVYYAAYMNHIGFYPTSSGISAFKEELKPYKWAKGSVQFPIKNPLPLDLIIRITKFRVLENSKK